MMLKPRTMREIVIKYKIEKYYKDKILYYNTEKWIIQLVKN